MNLAELIWGEGNQRKLKRVAVSTPEWPAANGKLFVQEMTARQRFQLMGMLGDGTPRDVGEFAVALVLHSTCDENGNSAFASGDAERLASEHGGPVRRLYLASADLNAMNEGAAEEVAKNSESAGTSDSSIVSALTLESQTQTS